MKQAPIILIRFIQGVAQLTSKKRKRKTISIYVADTEARERYQNYNKKLYKEINNLLMQGKKADHLKKKIKEDMQTYLVGWYRVNNKLKNIKDSDKFIDKIDYTYKNDNTNPWKSFLHALTQDKNELLYIYFHNLGYDVQNFLYWCIDDIEVTNVIYNNSYYSLCFEYQGKKIEFRDSYKLYALPLAKLGKMYDLTKKSDYATYDIDLNNKQMLEDMIYYFKYDILILGKVIYEHYKTFKDKSLTFASLSEKELQRCVKKDDKKNLTQNYYKIFDMEGVYDSYLYQYIKSAYFGGFVASNLDKVNQIQENVIVADNNSMYPFAMCSNMPDIRTMKPIKNILIHEFEIITIHITKLKVKKDGFYTFPKKAGFNVSASILSIDNLSAKTITLTNIDLINVIKNYDIEYTVIKAFKFDSIHRPFLSYVEKHKKEKEEATKNQDKARRLIAKLFLNSAYGKFAQNIILEDSIIDDDLKVVKVLKDEKDIKYNYRNILIAVFITAIARNVLFKAIDKVNKSKEDILLYCDTDAIHFQTSDIKEPNKKIIELGIEYSETEFGKWKAEQVCTKAIYLGNKRYWEEDINTGATIKGAGITKIGKQYLVKQGIENFNFDNGSIFVPSQTSKRVKSGVMIYETVKEIKPTEQVFAFMQ